MPDTYTSKLGLTKPEVGASRDTWGSKTNSNWDIVDDFVSMAMPIGAILDFGGPQAPSGWLICDGRLVSRATYSQLFAIIGTYWGSGDGSTTFALPSTPGRSCVGPGQVIDEAGNTVSFTFASRRGAVLRPIAQGNLPAVTLTTVAAGAHAHNAWTGGAGSHSHSTDAQGGHSHGGAYLPDHAHSAWTDTQGYHQHNVGLWGLGTGASPGGYGVISDAFGGRSYPTDGAGSHGHNVGIGGAGNLGLVIPWDGSHGHTVYGVGDHTHAVGVDTQGSHQHSVSLGGSGTALDIMNPVLVCTKIIYAGQQAHALSLEGLAVGGGPTRHLSSPMRGRH